MTYKLANLMGYAFILLGIVLFGISIICFQSEINVGTILGIVIIIIGFLVKVIFYRCPECGVMIPWRPLNVKHCPNCGKKL